MTLKAVLFDIDGTLIDSNDQHVEVWSEVLADAGYPVSREAVHAQIGKGADSFVPAFLPDADAKLIKLLGDRHGEIFKQRHLTNVKPFPCARDLLVRVCAAGQKVAIASSASSAELDHYIDLLDAHNLVAATTTSDDVEHTKPAPDIIRAALTKLGVRPEQAIMIGDSPYDIQAASACNVRTVALRSGKFLNAVLRDAGALVIYDDVAALLASYDESPLEIQVR